MTTKSLYLGLCILGTALPYSQFLPFLQQHGLNAREFVTQLFATRIGAFFGWDVIVSALALWLFVAIEGRRLRIPHRWAPVLAVILVGVSLGLPLFLYLRERQLQLGRVQAGSAPAGAA